MPAVLGAQQNFVKCCSVTECFPSMHKVLGLLTGTERKICLLNAGGLFQVRKVSLVKGK
jgi:hypothetical protein